MRNEHNREVTDRGRQGGSVTDENSINISFLLDTGRDSTVAFEWTRLQQVLATDVPIFVVDGETMKVDEDFKILNAQTEELGIKYLILGEFPELRCGKKNQQKSHTHRSRK